MACEVAIPVTVKYDNPAVKAPLARMAALSQIVRMTLLLYVSNSTSFELYFGVVKVAIEELVFEILTETEDVPTLKEPCAPSFLRQHRTMITYELRSQIFRQLA